MDQALQSATRKADKKNGGQERWRASLDIQVVIPISFRDRRNDSVFELRTPTAGYRGGLKTS